MSKIVQSGGFLADITGITSGLDNIVNFPVEVLESYSKELNNIATKKYKNNKNKNNLYIDAGLNMIGKKIKEKFGSGITLTNIEIKNIMKVIKFLGNRGILLKRTTTKITSQEGGFFNFLRLLMTAGLPLMKIVLTQLAKSVLIYQDYQQECQ